MAKRKQPYRSRSSRMEHVPPDVAKAISPRELLELKLMAAESELREKEALKLFEPMDWQRPFFESRARERILRKGNRAGGSCCSAVEVARAATRSDPYHKYNTTRQFDIWLVGLKLEHTGSTFHRLLFRPGAFKIIRDLETGKWRTYRPWTDSDREEESEDAPPLIPERYVEDITWYHKGEYSWTAARLINNVMIRAYSSESNDPPMGDPVDLVWVDEKVQHGHKWIPELTARLTDRKGKFIWSVAPLNNEPTLITMSERAAAQVGMPDPLVQEFRGTHSGNIYLDQKARDQTIQSWRETGGEEEVRMRDQGEFLTGEILMYPSFTRESHEVSDDMAAAWGERTDWCRYMIVDPGHTTCAVLFVAIAPKAIYENLVVVEDSLYIHKCDANTFAQKVAEKVDKKSYRAFIIDTRGSAPTSAGSGTTLRSDYTKALKAKNVRSEVTGSEFILGSEDRIGRASAVREMLRVRECGLPQLMVLRGAAPPIWDELKRYFKGVNTDGYALEVPDTKTAQRSHMMACVEYMAAYRPKYYTPEKIVKASSDQREYETWLADELTNYRRRRRGSREPFVNLGPVGSTPVSANPFAGVAW